jgi:predicted patatin/cPLA2 family phospholipase
VRSALLLSCLVLLVGGCARTVFHAPVPEDLVERAEVLGGARVRYWGDRNDPQLHEDLLRALREHPMTADPYAPEGPGLGGLVISGGGDAGAYGAGLLYGWTEHGDRPRFRIVTGVSTGSLIAPFAFLGPRYDASLKIYTQVSAWDVMRRRPITDWLQSDSMSDSRPLQTRLEKWMSDDVIRDIAAEHAKGRRLYIQTVNLDAQRPVIWDMGALAAVGTADAHQLFRQVIIASASIPGAFPPQYIHVKANGRQYDEMHVDGGVVSQMLLSTLPIDLAALRREMTPQPQPPRVYVIRNGVIRPEYRAVSPKLFPIVGRAIATIVKSQGATELKLMYHEAKAAGIEFYLSYIPDEYARRNDEEFNMLEMRKMFQIGKQRGRTGTAWRRSPPRYEGDPMTSPNE